MTWSYWISIYIRTHCVARGLRPLTLVAYENSLKQFSEWIRVTHADQSPDLVPVTESMDEPPHHELRGCVLASDPRHQLRALLFCHPIRHRPPSRVSNLEKLVITATIAGMCPAKFPDQLFMFGRWRRHLSKKAARQICDFGVTLLRQLVDRGMPPPLDIGSGTQQSILARIGSAAAIRNCVRRRGDLALHVRAPAPRVPRSPVDAIELRCLRRAANRALRCVRLHALLPKSQRELVTPRTQCRLLDMQTLALFAHGFHDDVDMWMRFVGVKHKRISMPQGELLAKEVPCPRKDCLRIRAGRHAQH
jgi:hypothetical protein